MNFSSLFLGGDTAICVQYDLREGKARGENREDCDHSPHIQKQENWKRMDAMFKL